MFSVWHSSSRRPFSLFLSLSHSLQAALSKLEQEGFGKSDLRPVTSGGSTVQYSIPVGQALFLQYRQTRRLLFISIKTPKKFNKKEQSISACPSKGATILLFSSGRTGGLRYFALLMTMTCPDDRLFRPRDSA